MKRTRIPDGVDVVLHVDFLDEYRKLLKVGRTYEERERYMDAIGRFTGVFETIDAHQIWLKYAVQGRFYEGIPAELAALREKIARLTCRYAKENRDA